MKILHVNLRDIEGGAARASYRLHLSLLDQSIDSKMLVLEKSSDDYRVIAETSKVKQVLNTLRPYIDYIPLKWYKSRRKMSFSPSWLPFSGVVSQINKINPDVVHLHWIAGGMMTIEEIVKIKVPIVWSLHDNWAFTGGCHVMWDCVKYKDGCDTCPMLGSDKENDLSRKIFKRKEKAYAAIDNITIVGLSSWIAECARESSLLKEKEVVCLPNPIDTQLYQPVDKKTARNILNLPLEKKLIAFGAMDATSDKNKGYTELQSAMDKLELENVELAIFGSSRPKDAKAEKYPTHYMGYLHDDVTLELLYSAVDVMVVPSLQENLSNAIMESLSCGTPVVSFDVGGNSNMIEHQKNGYLAEAFDTSNLKDGIEWILNNENYEVLCKNAREKIVSTFDSKIVAKQYIDLYKSITMARINEKEEK